MKLLARSWNWLEQSRSQKKLKPTPDSSSWAGVGAFALGRSSRGPTKLPCRATAAVEARVIISTQVIKCEDKVLFILWRKHVRRQASESPRSSSTKRKQAVPPKLVHRSQIEGLLPNPKLPVVCGRRRPKSCRVVGQRRGSSLRELKGCVFCAL